MDQAVFALRVIGEHGDAQAGPDLLRALFQQHWRCQRGQQLAGDRAGLVVRRAFE